MWLIMINQFCRRRIHAVFGVSKFSCTCEKRFLVNPDAVDVLEENELKEVTLSDDLPYFSNK